MGSFAEAQPVKEPGQEKPRVEETVITPSPVVETETLQPEEKSERSPTAVSTDIPGQEKPIIVEAGIASKTGGETGTYQTEQKGEKEDIVQQPSIASKRSLTAISTKKPMLLWLLPAILVPVISGIVVSIIFFFPRQSKKIEESSEPSEKVEKVVAPEIPKVIEKPKIVEKSFKPPAPEIKETKFRSRPIENLTSDAGEIMVKDKGFFDSSWNKSASGFPNEYEVQKEGKVVYDHASGLMWQQSGSTRDMTYEKAKAYVEALNSQNFAGYRDWRLPTLEEAMSLMEPTRKNGDLYIDPKFDKQQRWIWTSDLYSASSAWVVDFGYGGCYGSDIGSNAYVRAVR